MRHTTATYRVILGMGSFQGRNRDTDEYFDVSDPQGTVYVMADSPRDVYDLFGDRTVRSVERIGVGYVLASSHANGGKFVQKTEPKQ